MGHRSVEPHLRRFARVMRLAMTEPELRLWLQIRNRQLDGLRFRRQVAIGPYIADFFCAEKQLVIEIDGSQHFEADAEKADRERTNWLEANGIRVLRFDNREVLTNLDGVCARIAEVAGAGSP